MGRFINNLFDKLKDIVSPGDELIEPAKSQSVEATKPAEQPAEKNAENRTDITSGAPQLIAGVDYYMEGPYMVMTAKYLKKRGYCCESGCRHCPYGFNRKRKAEENSDNRINNIDSSEQNSDKTGRP